MATRRKTQPVPVSQETPAPKLRRPDAPPTADPAVETEAAESQQEEGTKHRQRSVYLADGIWERARSAVAWAQYFEVEDEPDSLAALLTEALEARLDEMETKHNNGEPFRKVRKLPKGPGRSGANRMRKG